MKTAMAIEERIRVIGVHVNLLLQTMDRWTFDYCQEDQHIHIFI